ncbi:MAG: proline--tRNA ligase [Spirochaetia bacterium]
MAEAITPREKDYSQWYVDIVSNAKLADYSPVKGCMVIRPRGYAIWERMQRILDDLFKETGVENAYFPMLIPQSFLEKEKEHVDGFAPEVAVVTHAGGSELEEPLILRPTSETMIWSMYKKWIHSWRDLPLALNQWANVIRWEKRTRLFLRTTEFLWQEGHTAHASAQEAQDRTLQMLEVYRHFAQEYLAMPVVTGLKSESEKFAGAQQTYSIEAMMQDKKALQAGTSHNLGQNFGDSFEVRYQNKEGKLESVWATSWGVSTRLIGGLIMTHSDDRGLVLPPKIAPIQVAIIPIFRANNKDKVFDFIQTLIQQLKNDGLKVFFDDDESKTPGFKFAECELSGTPIRLEIGERDIDAGHVILVRRDTLEKQTVAVSDIPQTIQKQLLVMQNEMYQKALKFREEQTRELSSYDEMKDYFNIQDGGFVEGFWCGSTACEERVKTQTKATIRNLPLHLNIEPQEGACLVCGQKSTQKALWGRSY